MTSMPGKHSPNQLGSHSQRVGELLSLYCNLPENEETLLWNILADVSSIGSLGKTPDDWLKKTLIKSLSSNKQISANTEVILKIIFPSHNNVIECQFGFDGGNCLSYSEAVDVKQPWLFNYLQ